jgi:hypothetical protein
MLDTAFGRGAARVVGVGVGAGAGISVWNLIGMYTTIPVGTWDIGRQVLFLAALGGISLGAAHTARAGRSWGRTGLSATLAAVGCATTVLVTYALSTVLGTQRIRQVPEFIRDYTYHGYTSPTTYFSDHYWALLELQVFMWIIGVTGLAAVGTVLGRAVSSVIWRRAA